MPQPTPQGRGAPQLTPRQKRYREKQRQRRQQMRFFALSFVVILLLAGVITLFIERPWHLEATDPESGLPQDTQGEPTEAPSAGGFGPLVSQTLSYTAPTPAMLAQPENGRVDMAYFDDALFIGDSLTQGFQLYSSGIANAHYAAYIGAGPRQMMEGTNVNINGETVSAINEILAAAPKKVYVLLGTNSLANLKDDALLKYYEDFIAFLTPQLPADTVYYLQAIPPVTAEKSAEEAYANTRITALNEQLAQLAYKYDWHYLDLYGALADEAGALRADCTAGTDGIHLNDNGYNVWREFLVTHTVYSPGSPYIAGSPYATV